MQVLRKLLLPIILWFALALVALMAYQYFSTVNANQAAAQNEFEHYYESFDGQVEASKKFALGLALEAATNPDIQLAFAEQDRAKLTELTLASYQKMDEQFGIPQYQYHTPPAISFLRLHQLDKFGDDLSAFRATVLEANQTQKPIAGLEIGRGGLGVRGVEPVFYEGKHIGTVEFGLNVDEKLLASLRGEYNVDWQIWLEKESAEVATFAPGNAGVAPGNAGVAPGNAGVSAPIEDLLYQTSTLKTPFFNQPEAYSAALKGKTTLNRIVSNGLSLAIFSAPIYDYSGKVIGVLDIIQDRTALVQANALQLLINLFLILLTMGSALILILVNGRRALNPIRALTEAAREIANGNLNRTAQIHSGDEFEQLGNTFDAMTSQLRDLVTTLETRVQERTAELETRSAELANRSLELASANQRVERRAAQLEAIAEVSSEIASLQKMDTLLPQITHQISEKFGYYHAGIFLLDEAREYALLVAANSEGGQRMLARGHKLQVGRVGIVGYATGTGNPRIALDTGMDAIFFNNPDLPETRSEMALPLRSSRGIIGALDVQSVTPNAFSQDDIRVLSTLADQISIAIENDRLFEQTEKSLTEVETIYRDYLRNEWGRISRSEKLLGFRHQSGRTRALEAPLLYPEMQAAIQSGEPEHQFDEDNNSSALAVPVKLRGEVIGVLNVRLPGKKKWREDELTIAQAVADRVAISLENARLLDESQRRANKERAIGEITSKISGSVNMQNVMKTTVAELERLMPGSDIVIQFTNPADKTDQPKTGAQ